MRRRLIKLQVLHSKMLGRYGADDDVVTELRRELDQLQAFGDASRRSVPTADRRKRDTDPNPQKSSMQP